MRKLFFGLVLLVSLFVGKMNAQITLVNSIDRESRISKYTYPDGTLIFISSDWSSNVIKIFNSDFSFKKEIILNISNLYYTGGLQIGNHGDWLMATSHLFNGDDLLEFVVWLKNQSTGQIGFAVVNENSTVLFSKYRDNSKDSYDGMHYYSSSTQNFMSVDYYNSNGGVTEIYSLPGTERFDGSSSSATSNLKSIQALSKSFAYPNPSKTSVNLTYTLPQGQQGTLSVYNLSGQLLKTFTVDGTFPYVTLDVANYTNGTYVYNVTVDGVVTATNKFVVEK